MKNPAKDPMRVDSPGSARDRAGILAFGYNPEVNYRPGAQEARKDRAARLVAIVELRRKRARAPHRIAEWAEAEADIKRMLADLI